MLALYGADSATETLDVFRYRKNITSVTSSTGRKVDLALLPPTTDTAQLHLKRVYLQVQKWLIKGGMQEDVENDCGKLEAVNWGLQFNEFFKPIPINKTAAPDELLKSMFCKCKSGYGKACSCRKAGLLCTLACFHCNGHDCLNSPALLRKHLMMRLTLNV